MSFTWQRALNSVSGSISIVRSVASGRVGAVRRCQGEGRLAHERRATIVRAGLRTALPAPAEGVGDSQGRRSVRREREAAGEAP